MKKRKITATFLLSVITLGTVGSISANADCMVTDDIDKSISSLNAYKIEDDIEWLGLSKYLIPVDYEAWQTYERGTWLYCYHQESSSFWIYPKETEDFDQICHMIESLDDSYKTYQYCPASGSDYHSIIVNKKDDKKGLNISEAKEICMLLKDKSKKITYSPAMYTIDHPGFINDMLEYALTEDEVKILKNFVSENGIDAEIVSSEQPALLVDEDKAFYTVVPDEKLAPMQYYELSKKLYDNLGISPLFSVQEDSLTTTDSVELDLNNFTNGDANEDGYLTLADSVAILQSIGNPDRYGLSAQGEFNADVDGNAGITGADALVIQQMELGIL